MTFNKHTGYNPQDYTLLKRNAGKGGSGGGGTSYVPKLLGSVNITEDTAIGDFKIEWTEDCIKVWVFYETSYTSGGYPINFKLGEAVGVAQLINANNTGAKRYYMDVFEKISDNEVFVQGGSGPADNITVQTLTSFMGAKTTTNFNKLAASTSIPVAKLKAGTKITVYGLTKEEA